jgi:hypothetical protein
MGRRKKAYQEVIDTGKELGESLVRVDGRDRTVSVGE